MTAGHPTGERGRLMAPPVLFAALLLTAVPVLLAYVGADGLSLACVAVVGPALLGGWSVQRAASGRGPTRAAVGGPIALSLLTVFGGYWWLDEARRVEISQVVGLLTAGGVAALAAWTGRAVGGRLVALRMRRREEAPPGEECPNCGSCYPAGTVQCRIDGARLVPSPVPLVLSGRYRLESGVGRGGMGTVYAARDTLLDRRVAVKVLRPDLARVPGAADRFGQEARAAARFAHPHVVTVFDYGIMNQQGFLVMEYLDGPTLRDLLRREERLAPARALALLRGVADAVDAAHQRRLVHRDLKPENIGVIGGQPEERAKVLDFGLAGILPEAAPVGGVRMDDGLPGGTPLYMAPEQLRGEPVNVSWDVWALAVIAFEMLSGQHPFAGPPEGGPTGGPVTAGARAALPAAFLDVFARALAIDPAVRPPTAAAFVNELQERLSA